MTDFANDPELKGNGSTMVAVGDHNGRVVLKFPEPVNWVAMDPANAMLIAEAMIKAAKACGHGSSILLLPRH